MSTQAQINANRLNSQQSTGPKTDVGKANSSHNAVKTALTGQTILLPTDDVAAYQKLGQLIIESYCPAAYLEEILVQSIIHAEWRLRRIPGLEASIYAIGQMELADQFPADQLQLRIYMKYERQLKNLSLQENRLRRMRDKDAAELKQMQAARQEKEEEKEEEAKKNMHNKPKPADASEPTVPLSAVALFNEAKQAAATNPSIDISQIGFEFSKTSAA